MIRVCNHLVFLRAIVYFNELLHVGLSIGLMAYKLLYYSMASVYFWQTIKYF